MEQELNKHRTFQQYEDKRYSKTPKILARLKNKAHDIHTHIQTRIDVCVCLCVYIFVYFVLNLKMFTFQVINLPQ